MSTSNDGISPEDEILFERVQRAMPPPSPEEIALEQKRHAYFRHLRGKLREPSDTDVANLVRLLLRVGHLVRAEQMPTRIPSWEDHCRESLINTLNLVDPLWATDGMAPDDYTRHRELARAAEDAAMEVALRDENHDD